MNRNDVILNDLKKLISYQTISSDKKSASVINDCAEWLAKHLLSSGLQRAEIYETCSHPVVYAEYITHPSLSTILFYGHYDVQPVDPVEKWRSPPFEAVINGDYMYGRGTSDDKGQLFIHIKAIEKLIRETGLPVNVKFLIEGSEEIGSAGLQQFVLNHKPMLKCDAVVASDTKMLSENIPAITYSLRGSLNAEITIETSTKDLHSGTIGGCVPDAVTILNNLLGSLHYKDHSVAIKDFYNDVVEMGKEERNFMRFNGPSDSSILKDTGTQIIWGERGFSLYELTTIRPAITITGFAGGYQGEGVKNVIPSSASAKLNFRLAAKQNPATVQALLDNHLKAMIPKGIGLKIKYSSQAYPVSFSRNNQYIIAAMDAYKQVFKVKPRMIRAGGTIPAVDYLHNILQAPVVLMGFAQASDNMHAPNERFYIPNLFKGIETSRAFMKNAAKLNRTNYAAAYY